MEKVHLIIELDQDLLAIEFDEPPEVKDVIVEILERRMKEYEANPSSAIPWSEFRRRMDSFRAERKARQSQA